MMNVERGQHSAVHGSHASHATGKGGKGAAHAAAGDQPATGFMALLSALDDALDGAGEAVGLAGADADTGKSATDMQAETAGNAQAAPDANVMSVALAATMGDATGLATALANGLVHGKAHENAAVSGDVAIDADNKVARRAQGLMADDKAGKAARTGAVAGANGAADSDAAVVAASARPAADATRGDLATVFEQLQNRLAAKGERDDMTQARELAQTRATAVARSSAMATATEARVDRTDRAASLAAAMPTFRQTVGADDAAAQAVKGIDSRPGEGASASRNEASTSWMQREFTPTVQFDGTVGGTDAAQPAPEAQIADQVSYWISQGIRNAELTVGGEGSDPVQVSISMSGNEAQVEFRAEHAGVREMLANSVDHLKEALRSEGMLLAGVSVGSSGADTAGERGARSGHSRGDAAPGATRATDRVEAAVTGVPKPRTPAGAVDLFV